MLASCIFPARTEPARTRFRRNRRIAEPWPGRVDRLGLTSGHVARGPTGEELGHTCLESAHGQHPVAGQSLASIGQHPKSSSSPSTLSTGTFFVRTATTARRSASRASVLRLRLRTADIPDLLPSPHILAPPSPIHLPQPIPLFPSWDGEAGSATTNRAVPLSHASSRRPAGRRPEVSHTLSGWAAAWRASRRTPAPSLARHRSSRNRLVAACRCAHARPDMPDERMPVPMSASWRRGHGQTAQITSSRGSEVGQRPDLADQSIQIQVRVLAGDQAVANRNDIGAIANER